jgi:hypothetical protein
VPSKKFFSKSALCSKNILRGKRRLQYQIDAYGIFFVLRKKGRPLKKFFNRQEEGEEHSAGKGHSLPAECDEIMAKF